MGGLYKSIGLRHICLLDIQLCVCVRSLFLQVINIMASLWTYFQPKVALILNVSVLLGGDHSSAGLPIIVTDMQFENYTK